MKTTRSLIFLAFCFLSATNAKAQTPTIKEFNPITVKSNLLNFIAGKPALSVEKIWNKSVGVEVSYVQGRFRNFFLTDLYSYKGFLLRGKKYLEPVRKENVAFYIGAYIGNLERHIQSDATTIINGYVAIPGRDFTAMSIRGGGSLGACFYAKSGFTIDAQYSLGYGRYLNLNKADPDTRSAGYPDVQTWLSIGYSF